VLLPLVEATVANVRERGPSLALTGPVRRGDAGTVERNLKALSAVNPAWLEVYRLLAAQGAELAEKTGTAAPALDAIRGLLNAARRL
jgi:predicted short-subunit dehydrogenase-like oxidoreductase (DUF2520 family)